MAFTLAQINALVNAGYKLEEILEVNGPVENPAPAPAPAPAPVENPVEHVEKPISSPVGNEAVLDAINNLTKVIQSGNIRMGGFPAPVTPDDPGQILANIINPPAKTGKK